MQCFRLWYRQDKQDWLDPSDSISIDQSLYEYFGQSGRAQDTGRLGIIRKIQGRSLSSDVVAAQ